MSYQITKWHGGNLSAYSWVKEANMERLHCVWFQLCEILEKANLRRQWKDEGYQGWGRARRDEQGIFRAVKLTLHIAIVLVAKSCPTLLQPHEL